MDRSVPKGRAAHGERGATLIEVLVASAIMASAALVLVMGMGALYASSTQNRQATTASVVARDYAESLELAVAQTGAWCNITYPVAYTPPAGYAVAPTFGACPADDGVTPQYQTVLITVTTPTGAQEALRMVVREP